MNKKLLKELSDSGVLFTESDVVFITKDETGQIVWLEIGNKEVGLTHIIERHLDDFSNAIGLTKDTLPSFLEDVISKGRIVSNTLSSTRKGYTRVYDYDGNYYTVTGIGSNGFIVTAYPTPKEE
ncbi:MAG: hypothetical protein K6B28_07610 [Lachnospiraceae bacterium]|nr:hypothetical protein [Lachnospiraceae bacterium]